MFCNECNHFQHCKSIRMSYSDKLSNVEMLCSEYEDAENNQTDPETSPKTK